MPSTIQKIAASPCDNVSQRPLGLLLLLAVMLAVSVMLGCSGGSSESDGNQNPLTRAERLRQDIDFLAAQLRAIHPNVFHSITEEALSAAAARLKHDLPALTANEAFVEMVKWVALAASQEDGHTTVDLFQATNFRFFPLRLYILSDGVFVIDAAPPYEAAIGKRVVQIGGMDMAAINALIDPLITRDNDTTLLFKKTLHYVVPEILHTLGIIDDPEQGDFLLEDANGNRSVLSLPAIDKDVYRETIGPATGLFEQSNPLYLRNLSERFWMQILPDTNALYIKYNGVQADTQSGWTIRAFSDQIAATVSQQVIDKVIVDVRQNGGGNNATFESLLNVLSSPDINQPNTLYVLIGRQTFSAAANFVTALEQRAAHVVFAGERTGGSLNNYGDTQKVDLPHTGYGIAIPTRYWTFARPGDLRLAIVPHLPADLTSDDYFNHHDPVLEAVLND